MKLKFLIFNFSFLILTACGVTKPVATTHTERIEERVIPVAVGADTIEITDNRVQSTDNRVQSTDLTPPPYRHLPYKQGRTLEEYTTPKNSPLVYRGSGRRPRGFITPYSIKSTRGVKISRYETDTTSTLRITLQPDTVFVPYTNHIRSDTIVVPDRVCQQKLNHSNMTNLFLILILIAMLMLAVRRAKLV